MLDQPDTARSTVFTATQDLEEWADIVESSLDAVVSKDLSGTITGWNSGAEALFGYTAQEIIGQSILRLIPPERHGEEDFILTRVARGEGVRRFETIRLCKDGSIVDVSITVSPVSDRSGTVIGASQVARNIAERRRAEVVLRQNAALFATLISQAPMGTYVVDAQFRVRQINAEAMPAFASVQPLIGRDFRQVLDILWGAEVGEQIADIFRHTLETGERYISPPFTEKRQDLGIEQSYEWQTQRVTLPDGGFGVVCYFHEVTERARATAALRASEQRMRLATEATQVGIWEWNVITNQIRWDAQMFRIYGIAPTPDGIIDYADWRGTVVPEDLAGNEAILQDTVRRQGQSERSFRIRRRDDGEHRHVAAVETVRVNAQGQVEWLVGTNLDITKRMQADEELRNLAAKLHEADRRKDEFLATLAHELRNPLAPIRNGISLLQRGVPAAQQDRVVAMMERQVGQLVNLVDDLLDVSRVSLGKIELRIERVGLDAAIADAIESCRPVIEQGHHAVEFEPGEGFEVDGDRTRLTQVVANLLTNAAKYSERGGSIRIVTHVEGQSAVISVIDRGVGIAPDVLPTLWNLFSQVRDTLDKAQGGIGIGLSLVKKLVELHGGSVEAQSPGIGKGSTFIVRLPLAPTPGHRAADIDPAVLASLEPARETTRPKLRVLVVDDNLDGAASLAALLEMSGHETTTAANGPEALARARSFLPDAVLCDIGLPGMSGYEVATRIRADTRLAHALLIAVTGWGTEADKRRSHEAGFDSHLTKPVDPQVIEALLRGGRLNEVPSLTGGIG